MQTNPYKAVQITQQRGRKGGGIPPRRQKIAKTPNPQPAGSEYGVIPTADKGAVSIPEAAGQDADKVYYPAYAEKTAGEEEEEPPAHAAHIEVVGAGWPQESAEEQGDQPGTGADIWIKALPAVTGLLLIVLLLPGLIGLPLLLPCLGSGPLGLLSGLLSLPPGVLRLGPEPVVFLPAAAQLFLKLFALPGLGGGAAVLRLLLCLPGLLKAAGQAFILPVRHISATVSAICHTALRLLSLFLSDYIIGRAGIQQGLIKYPKLISSAISRTSACPGRSEKKPLRIAEVAGNRAD